MSLRMCPDTELHEPHRQDDKYKNWCPGLHDPSSSTWLVAPLPRRGYAQRPHFFVDGQPSAVCGRGHRSPRMLGFDAKTGFTTDPDPRIGAPQSRRECGHCRWAVRPD